MRTPPLEYQLDWLILLYKNFVQLRSQITRKHSIITPYSTYFVEIINGIIMENIVEKLLYSARWIMAPIYLGLSLVLLALGIKFFQEVFHLLPNILSTDEVSLILVTLSLIDISLVGGLIVMVMFSGYENFVSKIDIAEEDDKLGWLGKLDTGSLKNKVSASIVAISSIHLLKVFMNTENIDSEKIKWYLLLHITFVLSAFAMGYLDKITKK